MERQRQTKDIQHPMYDTVDNASSAVDGCNALMQHIKLTMLLMASLTYWSFILDAYKNSKTCEMCSSTSDRCSARLTLSHSQPFCRPTSNLIPTLTSIMN